MSKKTAYGTYNDLAFQFYAKEFLESKEEIHIIDRYVETSWEVQHFKCCTVMWIKYYI